MAQIDMQGAKRTPAQLDCGLFNMRRFGRLESCSRQGSRHPATAETSQGRQIPSVVAVIRFLYGKHW